MTPQRQTNMENHGKIGHNTNIILSMFSCFYVHSTPVNNFTSGDKQ